jgi:hypothetical protein
MRVGTQLQYYDSLTYDGRAILKGIQRQMELDYVLVHKTF